MDRKQQAARIQRIVDVIAQKAIAMPPDARLAFIKGEIAKVREDFRRTYETDPRLFISAMDLINSMYGQVKTRLEFLEMGSGKTGALDE